MNNRSSNVLKELEPVTHYETINFQSARKKYILYKKRLKLQRLMGLTMMLLSRMGLSIEGGFLLTLLIGCALMITKEIVITP